MTDDPDKIDPKPPRIARTEADLVEQLRAMDKRCEIFHPAIPHVCKK